MEWTAEMLADTISRGQSELAWVIRERACSYLAQRCDFATTRDRMGYNGRDAVPGHSFADQIAKSQRANGYKLSYKQQAWAAQFLVKYVATQLLPVVEHLTATTTTPEKVEPQVEEQTKPVTSTAGIICPKCGGSKSIDELTCTTCSGVGRINATVPTVESTPEPDPNPEIEAAWQALIEGPSPAEKKRVQGAINKHNRLSKRTVHGGAIPMG